MADNPLIGSLDYGGYPAPVYLTPGTYDPTTETVNDAGVISAIGTGAAPATLPLFQIEVKTVANSPYTIPAGNVFLLASASAVANFLATLPAATGSGASIVVKRMDDPAVSIGFDVQIAPTGTDTIDGVNAADHLSRRYVAINYFDYAVGAWARW